MSILFGVVDKSQLVKYTLQEDLVKNLTDMPSLFQCLSMKHNTLFLSNFMHLAYG